MKRTGSNFAIPDYGDPKDPEVRAKYGYLEATVSIVGNLVLFIIKLILGIFINSIALIADAFHTLSDVGTSGVVLFGFKMAKKPADKEHPHGHGRIEYISTLIIAILLVLTGLGFIQQSFERILESIDIVDNEFTVLIAFVVMLTAVVKELMALFSFSIAKRIDSDTLSGDAWHHRSDALSSVAVGLSILGSKYGYPILDPIFGIVVALIIIWVGVNIFRRASNFLIGVAPDVNMIKKIEEITSTMKEVKGVHDVSIHDYGTSKVISLHVEVKSDLLLDDAHRIADTLERRIEKHLTCSTIIHLDPKETRSEKETRKRVIEKILQKDKDIISFHKIQIISDRSGDVIKMHVTVDSGMSIEDSHILCHRLEDAINKECGRCKVDIHFEPCLRNCKACTFSCGKKDAL